MSALVVDDIGLLVTNDPERGEGALGLVRDAALVIEGERVAAIEPAGADGDERIDAAGRCVIPGFVDSHTHLVFAGDRAGEFAARMAGRAYAAGGIRVTTEATRGATDDELVALTRLRRDEGLQLWHDPRRGQERLRARRGDREAPVRDRRSLHRRRHVSRRPPRPDGVRRAGGRICGPRLWPNALRLCAVGALDRRLLRNRRLRRGPVARDAFGRTRGRTRPARARQPARAGARREARS